MEEQSNTAWKEWESMLEKQEKMESDAFVMLGCQLAMERLKRDPTRQELVLPTSLTGVDRRVARQLSGQLGLCCASRGRGTNRRLVVAKTNFSPVVSLDLNVKTIEALTNSCCNQTDKEVLIDWRKNKIDTGRFMGKFNVSAPHVPLLPPFSSLMASSSLDLASMINSNVLTVLKTPKGLSKTISLSTSLLELLSSSRTPSRLLSVHDDAMLAVAAAEQVAAHRGERVGHVVGFQIWLESRVSPNTVLTFTTHEIFLRTAMGDGSRKELFANTTHVIIEDDGSRQDGLADLVLAVIDDNVLVDEDDKENKGDSGNNNDIQTPPDDETVLPSNEQDLTNGDYNPAWISVREHTDTNALACAHEMPSEYGLHVALFRPEDDTESWPVEPQVMTLDSLPPVNDHEVKHIFLEQILTLVGHPERNRSLRNCLGDEVSIVSSLLRGLDLQVALADSQRNEDARLLYPTMFQQVDHLVAKSYIEDQCECFETLIDMMHLGLVHVDYKHSNTGVTTLMAAASNNRPAYVHVILAMGAKIDEVASNGNTAAQLARRKGHLSVAQLLDDEAKLRLKRMEATQLSEGTGNIGFEMGKKLPASEPTPLNVIDRRLVVRLIETVHNTEQDLTKAILVFLPTFDDIAFVKHNLRVTSILPLVLHSRMASVDLQHVLQPITNGRRKVVFAIDMAEAKVEVNDVAIVIDSGKAIDKEYKVNAVAPKLKVSWVNHRVSNRRASCVSHKADGGIVYHLYSRNTYEKEIVNNKQRSEECLDCEKMCLFVGCLSKAPISEFISNLRNPPSPERLFLSLNRLCEMEALDVNMQLTEIGSRLVDIPLAPHLAKSLLHAITLKCLDPVLTIVCALNHMDPFILQSSRLEDRYAVMSARLSLSLNAFSDHLSLLRVFQEWQTACCKGEEATFCVKNSVSGTTLKLVGSMRSQVLGHLRAAGFVRTKGQGDLRSLNKHADNWPVVKACLVAGYYPNLAQRTGGKLLRTKDDRDVLVHGESVLLRRNFDSASGVFNMSGRPPLSFLPTNWLLYDRVERIGSQLFLRNVTAISATTVALFAGPTRLVDETEWRLLDCPSMGESSDDDRETSDSCRGGYRTIRVDEWIAFKLRTPHAQSLMKLRLRYASTFLSRMNDAAKATSAFGSQGDGLQDVADEVAAVLTKEEVLPLPRGVGQRPQPVSAESICSSPLNL